MCYLRILLPLWCVLEIIGHHWALKLGNLRSAQIVACRQKVLLVDVWRLSHWWSHLNKLGFRLCIEIGHRLLRHASILLFEIVQMLHIFFILNSLQGFRIRYTGCLVIIFWKMLALRLIQVTERKIWFLFRAFLGHNSNLNIGKVCLILILLHILV